MQEEKTTKEIIEERFKELPSKIKDAIVNSGWENDVRRISEKYKLRIDQSNLLENQILLLMLGLQDVEVFFDILGENIKNDDNKLENILDEVEVSIVGKIKHLIVEATAKEKFQTEIPKPLTPIRKDPQHKTPDQKIDEIVKRQNFVKEDRQVSDLDDEILTLTREEILKGIEEPDSISLAESNNLPGLSSANVMPQQGEKFEIRNSKFETPRHPSTELRTSSSGQANLKHEIPNPKFQANTKQVEVKEKEIPADLPIISTPKPFSANKDNLSNMEVEESNNPIDPVSAGLNNKISTSIKDSYKVTDPYKEPIE